MTGPLTYHEAMELSLRDQVDRYEELTDRDLMARSIATLRARGEYDEARHRGPADYQPLTVAEHLEMLALGEAVAFYYRHPAVVDHAVRAGATWEQIAAARNTTAEAARAAYREWAEGQHQYAGMSAADYAAAIKAAGASAPGQAEDTRRLDAIRGGRHEPARTRIASRRRVSSAWPGAGAAALIARVAGWAALLHVLVLAFGPFPVGRAASAVVFVAAAICPASPPDRHDRRPPGAGSRRRQPRREHLQVLGHSQRLVVGRAAILASSYSPRARKVAIERAIKSRSVSSSYPSRRPRATQLHGLVVGERPVYRVSSNLAASAR